MTSAWYFSSPSAARRGAQSAIASHMVFRQYVPEHQFLFARMTDSHPAATEVRANVGDDGAKAVVSGRAAARLHAEPAWRQVQFVVEHHQILRLELVEL